MISNGGEGAATGLNADVSSILHTGGEGGSSSEVEATLQNPQGAHSPFFRKIINNISITLEAVKLPAFVN